MSINYKEFTEGTTLKRQRDTHVRSRKPLVSSVLLKEAIDYEKSFTGEDEKLAENLVRLNLEANPHYYDNLSEKFKQARSVVTKIPIIGIMSSIPLVSGHGAQGGIANDNNTDGDIDGTPSPDGGDGGGGMDENLSMSDYNSEKVSADVKPIQAVTPY